MTPADPPPRTVTASAPAKINLTLGVGASRADGFHALATVYQAVDLYDRVTVRPADRPSVVVRPAPGVVGADVPSGSDNVALRAAALLARHAGVAGSVHVEIDKTIPVAGGMAGGSADAAAALVACDALWGLHTPFDRLVTLAAELGSDVPFALVGGTAAGTGRGEVVSPLVTDGELWWVARTSAEGLSTPRVYAEFDAGQAPVTTSAPPTEPAISPRLVAALAAGDPAALGAALSNDLQEPALRLRPELREVLARGPGLGAVAALLSGSGPTCLFLAADGAAAERIRERLTADGLGPAHVLRGPVGGAQVLSPVAAGPSSRARGA